MANSLDDAVSLVGSRVALVAGPGVDAAFLSRVRQIVHAKDPFGLLVDAMTDSGLRSIPSLACAVTERGGVRILVRGSATAVVKTTAGKTETISASGVSTWHEQAVARAEEVALVAANAAGASTTLMLFLDPTARRSTGTRPAKKAVPSGPPMPVTLDDLEPAPRHRAPVDRAPRSEPVAPARPVHEDTINVRPARPVPPPAAPDPEESIIDFSHLIDETQFRGAEAAAVRPDEPAGDPPAAPAAPAPAVPSQGQPTLVPQGDHDGNTISIGELRQVTAQARDDATIQVRGRPAPGAAGPSIQAVHCPAGHPNAPTSSSCRACGSPILDHAISLIPRPSVGRIRFDDGSTIDLDRGALLGRKPTNTPGQETYPEAPRLVALPDPEQSLSRVHAEVRLEGWQVLVVDRGSMNGTRVELPGQEPVRLRADDPCLLVAGARVTLGDVTGFVLEP